MDESKNDNAKFWEELFIFLSDNDYLGKIVYSLKKSTYKGGILEYVRFSTRVNKLITIAGVFLFLFSLFGIFYSYKTVYHLSSTQEFYNRSLDPEDRIKPEDNIFTNTHEIDNYYLFIPSITILIISIPTTILSFCGIFNYNKSFICPDCKKRILLKNIQDYTCPICNETGLNYENFIKGCSHCRDNMRFYQCPNPKCNQPIDLEAPYNEKELIRSRYEFR